MTLNGTFHEFYENTKHEPVFVVLGVQGSGTNLLRSILVGAFKFSVIQDRSLIFNAAAQLSETPTRDEVRRQFQQVVSRLLPSSLTRKTQKLVTSNGSFAGVDEAFEHASITSPADFALFVYSYSAFRLGTRLMAIKSDDMWEYLDHLDRVIPNRRLIFLTRDLRDNLLSITKKDFGPVEPLVAAGYVKKQFASYEAEFQRTPASKRLHLRYEDLLEGPLDVVSRLSAQFDLEPTPEGLAAVRSLPIRKHNVRKWSGLHGRTLAQCEAMLRSELDRFGYGTTCEPVAVPGASTLTNARARDVVKRVPQKVARVIKRLRS